GVVGNEERAVERDGDADRAAPNVTVVHDESSHEIFVFAGGVTGLVQGHANEFVSDADGFVPGSVLRGENIAAVLVWKVFAIVESHLQRSVVRMNDDVRRDDLAF